MICDFIYLREMSVDFNNPEEGDIYETSFTINGIETKYTMVYVLGEWVQLIGKDDRT